MIVYVIKRDDGKYFKTSDTWKGNEVRWVSTILYAKFFDYSTDNGSKRFAQEIIKGRKLQNCKPVKIEIKEVEE